MLLLELYVRSIKKVVTIAIAIVIAIVIAITIAIAIAHELKYKQQNVIYLQHMVDSFLPQASPCTKCRCLRTHT